MVMLGQISGIKIQESIFYLLSFKNDYPDRITLRCCSKKGSIFLCFTSMVNGKILFLHSQKKKQNQIKIKYVRT